MEEVVSAVAAPAYSDADVLYFDPFDGDFGDQGDKIFKDKMVIARKPGPCSHCQCEIHKGERVRSMAAKFDGELMGYRWCAACCMVMGAISVYLEGGNDDDEEEDDPSDQWEARLQTKKATS